LGGHVSCSREWVVPTMYSGAGCIQEKIYMKDISEWTFRNTFTAVIAQKLPSVGNAINELKNVGCCYAEMSGSGSTVFGAFTSELQAERCCNLLDTSWNCKLVRTI